MGVINKESQFENGEFLNRYFNNKVLKNKNVILIFTGATGSGKTYSCLSQAEKWYKYKFKKKFPSCHVAFNLGSLIEKIDELNKAKNLNKGDLFILEEAGANFGNLDFQNKLAKLFGYILQSFRSKNLILLMTVPVLTMVNKQARQLTHGHFTTESINFEDKICIVKPLFHQLAQSSGKSYWKYPRAKIGGRFSKIHRLKFDIPSNELIVEYEKAKDNFIGGLTDNFVKEWKMYKEKEKVRLDTSNLTANQKEREEEYIRLISEGKNQKQIAKELGFSEGNISTQLKSMRKRGFNIQNIKKKSRLLNN